MKTQRIYLRITPEDKKFLQKLADTRYDGTISALFDDMIQKLKEQEEEEKDNGTTQTRCAE